MSFLNLIVQVFTGALVTNEAGNKNKDTNAINQEINKIHKLKGESRTFLFYRTGKPESDKVNTIISLLSALSNSNENADLRTFFLPLEFFKEELEINPSITGRKLLEDWINNNSPIIEEKNLDLNNLLQQLKENNLQVFRDDYSDIGEKGLTDIPTRVLGSRLGANALITKDDESRKDYGLAMLKLYAARSNGDSTILEIINMINLTPASVFTIDLLKSALNAIKISMGPIDYNEITELIDAINQVEQSL